MAVHGGLALAHPLRLPHSHISLVYLQEWGLALGAQVICVALYMI